MLGETSTYALSHKCSNTCFALDERGKKRKKTGKLFKRLLLSHFACFCQRQTIDDNRENIKKIAYKHLCV